MNLRAALLLGAIFFSSLLLSGCIKLFFQPSQQYFPGAERVGITPQWLWYHHQGELYYAWYLPAQTEQTHGQVVFMHGNAQNVSAHIGSVAWLPAQGYGVLMVGYPGYGGNPGKPGIEAVFSLTDTLLAEWQSSGLAEGDWHMLGQSLGGSLAATYLASRDEQTRFCSLALDAAFASYRQIFREKLGELWLTWPLQYPLSWTVSNRWSPDRWADQIQLPVLLLHSEEDIIIPFHHQAQLYEQLPDAERVITQGVHIATFWEADNQQALTGFWHAQTCSKN